jgi:membrane dipeptidase
MTVADLFERELAIIQRELYVNRDRIRLAYSAEDIARNQQDGIMSAVLTLEGTAGIGYDPQMLEDLYKIGFRIASLGWNESNPLTGSNVTGGGLTELGREFVREAQRLGVIVDVSHLSDEGFWDIMDITSAPVIATHSNSRSIYNHSRNLTDDMFRAICQSNGVAGFNQYTAFIGENPDLDACCDHMFHFLEMDPEGRHIALGGDLDGCDTLPAGFTGVESYPAFAKRLLDRGAGEKIVENIFWNNAMGVMKHAVCQHQK